MSMSNEFVLLIEAHTDLGHAQICRILLIYFNMGDWAKLFNKKFILKLKKKEKKKERKKRDTWLGWFGLSLGQTHHALLGLSGPKWSDLIGRTSPRKSLFNA